MMEWKNILMRMAALGIGMLGGLFALVGAIIALTSAGVGNLYNTAGSGQVLLLGLLGLLAALAGIIGAVMALKRPLPGGLLMLVAAVGGTLALTGAFIVGGVLLLIAGVLALTAAWIDRHAMRLSPVRIRR